MTARRCMRGLGAVAVAILMAAGRGQADDQIICPLSEQQQEQSQSDWEKVGAIFKHDRCSNCHGKKNPFTEDTEHPDRMTLELDENGEISEAKTFEICESCHETGSTVARWKIPPAGMQWWNQSIEELCRTQHRLKPPNIFIRHNENDPLIKIAFLGTMALNDVGRDLVETEPYPAPPPETHDGFMGLIRAWYESQDLTEDTPRWQGDEVECGCAPQLYEIVIDVKYNSANDFAGCSGEGHIEETIPIDFNSSGGESKYTGTGTGTLSVSNFSCPITGCTVAYRPNTTDVFLKGDVVKVDGAPSKLTMTVARTVGPTSFDITCPCDEGEDCPYPVTVTVPQLPTETGDVEPELDARLGDYERGAAPSKVTITIRKRN